MQTRTEKDSQVQRIILVEGCANFLVLTVKLVVGLATGSLAVIGDAVHSLTDIINNIVAWVVVDHASAPADSGHPYGHRKFETIAVFGLASLLVVLAFELAMQAIRRGSVVIASGGLELGLMLGVLAVNIAVTAWQHAWAKKLGSDLLHADASHTFTDVLTTIVVIGGWQLSAMGFLWLDRICAFGVAGLIFYLAFKLFQRVVPALVDESAMDQIAVINAVMAVSGVEKVIRLRSRWVGSDTFVDMKILVDSRLSTGESHAIADQIESVLEQDFNAMDVTIHIEPA
ncbi:MAG: cation diffusion facilitator family transporter [Pseudomonadales bacterium]|nr:cation diffusion facilitator family transporter [Pseudomonadales bacterium]